MPQKLLCRKYSLKFKAVARRCNDRKIQRDGTEKYKFQDMDILNISCSGRVRYFPPSFCVTTYFCEYANRQRSQLAEIWTDEEINHALEKGIVHYNGPKPWNSWCPNFDIWWETYRKSPIYDQRKYFEFFYSKVDVLDSLTLWKRIKILARYFIVGKSRK